MIKKETNVKKITGITVTPVRNKTVVVEIERLKKHRLYGKNYKVNKKIKARCEIADLERGSEVVISECRPLSKEVSFKVLGVVE